MEDLALKISHVSKEYRLGSIGGATLRGELQSKLAKLRGREDPNLKIGQKAHEKNERFLALDDVSLEIRKGERIGIIGHNGAGKSTLLKLICRVTGPTKGEIYMNGRLTSMLEVGTGFHGELTGRENIYLNGAILGMSKSEISAKFDDIVKFSEVGQFIDTPVKRYSSGMHVKLGFAVASHLDSEIMIMDEVLAVGDMQFQKKCLKKMREAAEDEGRTILYVSHNMTTIRELCDRVVVLEHGKVVYDGDVEGGIAVYMDVKDSNDMTIDYSNIPRLDWLKNTYLKTLRASFVGKENNIFTDNEKMKLCLEWINERDFEKLCLRTEIKSSDDMPVATAVLYDFYNGKAGENGKLVYDLDLSLLSAGRYKMNYVFFVKDKLGHNADVDCVHGLYFERVVSNNLVWNAKNWGKCLLPSPDIEVLN